MRLFVILGLIFSSVFLFAEIDITDTSKLRKELGVDKFPFSPKMRDLVVVVIDKGFRGYTKGNPLVSNNTTYISKIEEYPADYLKGVNDDIKKTKFDVGETNHGFRVAKALCAVLGKSFKLYLIEAPSITPFEVAADFSAYAKADIVVHSQNYDYSNGDGTGLYNMAVSKFVNARPKSFWFNAAGNEMGMVYRGAIAFDNPKKQAGELLKFENGAYLEFVSNGNNVSIQLNFVWNSFSETEEGTNKDLDFYVYDEKDQLYTYRIDNEEIEAKSEKRQVFAKDLKEKNQSDLPVEAIDLMLKKGKYRIYAKNYSGNFVAGDELTVTMKVKDKRAEVVNADKGRYVPVVEFLSASRSRILKSPADSEDAITIGVLSPICSVGPTSNNVIKPEVFLRDISLVDEDGDLLSGSSISNALFAGIVGILKVQNPSLNRKILLDYINTLDLPSKYSLISQIEELKGEAKQSFMQKYSVILNALYQDSRQGPVLFGKYPDGQYVIGLPFSPSKLKGWFDNVPEDGNESYEYFILPSKQEAGGQLPMTYMTYTRNRKFDGAENMQAYPWQQERKTNSLRKTDYIELRLAVRKKEREKELEEEAKRWGRVWKTPAKAL